MDTIQNVWKNIPKRDFFFSIRKFFDQNYWNLRKQDVMTSNP